MRRDWKISDFTGGLGAVQWGITPIPSPVESSVSADAGSIFTDIVPPQPPPTVLKAKMTSAHCSELIKKKGAPATFSKDGMYCCFLLDTEVIKSGKVIESYGKNECVEIDWD